jgi:NitT/TauT family transport system substrate-binding protein
MRGYRETVDWLYSSPDAIPQFMEFSGFSEPAVKRMLAEFIPKESMQSVSIDGVAEAQQDAVQFKFLSAPLSDPQLKELIQIPASSR